MKLTVPLRQNDGAFLRELAEEQQSKKSKRLSVLSFTKSSSTSETKSKQRPKSVLISPKIGTFGIEAFPKTTLTQPRPIAAPNSNHATTKSSTGTSIIEANTLLTFPSPKLRDIDLSLHLPGKRNDGNQSEVGSAGKDDSSASLNGPEGWTRERIGAREPAVRPPKSPRRANPDFNTADERSRLASLPKSLHTDELATSTPRSRVISIPNSELMPTRASGLVHGIKKKFGRNAHSIKGMEGNSLGIDFSETFRRGSAGLTPAIEKVPTVNSIAVPSIAPPSFAQYSFPSNRPTPIRRTSSSSRGLLKKVVSQDGSKNGSILKQPSIDSLSSRFITATRDSCVSSHSRKSSQHSYIEHTSFDEARSGSFTPMNMNSSHLLERQKAKKYIREEVAREDPCSQMVYTSSRRGLSPQRGGFSQSPVRPSRVGEDIQAGDAPSDRVNAAHEKKWIAASNTYPLFWNSGRRGSDGVTEVSKSNQNHSLHKMHSVDGLTLEGRVRKASTTASCIPPLPSRGSLSHQITHKRSDRSLTKKQSMKSLHISRPTTIIVDSTSADLIEVVNAPAEAQGILSADSSASSIRRIRGQERRKQVPSPLHSASNAQDSPRSPRTPRSNKQNSPRYTRSAGGWIEQSPPVFGATTRSPTSSTFARMQQEHISQTIRLAVNEDDTQSDATAVFDCIPSPDASNRVRTKSSPTLFGLNLSGDDSVEISGSLKSATSSPSIGEAYTPLSAQLELEPDIVFNGTIFRSDSLCRSPSDCRDMPMKRGQGNVQNLLLCSPPRSMPADAPESPTEEVEVLDDDDGDRPSQHHSLSIDEEYGEEDDSSNYSLTPTSLERRIFGDAISQKETINHTSSQVNHSLSKSRSFDQLQYYGNMLTASTITTSSMSHQVNSPIDSNEYYVPSHQTGRRASYTYV